jgi:hypothetical protein
LQSIFDELGIKFGRDRFFDYLLVATPARKTEETLYKNNKQQALDKKVSKPI